MIEGLIGGRVHAYGNARGSCAVLVGSLEAYGKLFWPLCR